MTPDIRLILTDIDLTILPRGDKQVSRRTVDAFHAARAAGLRVGPSSGRGIGWLAPMFYDDPVCYETAVATNGLEVYLDGRRIHRALFDPQRLGRLVSQAHDLLPGVPGVGVVCFTGTQPHLLLGTREGLARLYPAYAEKATVGGGVPEGDITKANLFFEADRDETARVVRQLNHEVEGLDFDLAMPGYLNVMPAGENKGAGIRRLCEAIGCGLDQVVVFGDAGNDLAMFDVVPNSVAVANATPDAAAAARWHIGACADDAVAAAVESLAAGEWPFVR